MRVAILVGHYGTGTGNTWNDRDEWWLAFLDANTLQQMLIGRGIQAEICYVDRDNPFHAGIGHLLAERGGLKDMNFALRAQQAKAFEADVAIELHYNGFTDTSVKGHEVLIDNDIEAGEPSDRLAHLIHKKLDEAFHLHPQRGVKPARLKVLEILRNMKIPACLVEPAFLFETLLDDRRAFQGLYLQALVDALVEFGGLRV